MILLFVMGCRDGHDAIKKLWIQAAPPGIIRWMRPLPRILSAIVLVAAALEGAPLMAKVRIMATVFPLREFAAAVAGERGEAELLLPPGAGVHTWQPKPGDIGRLARCDLLLYIGAGLEPWLPGLLKAVPGARFGTLEAAAGIALVGGDEHGVDPHIWLDFEIDARLVKRIAEELALIDPPGAPEFRSNAEKTAARLRALDLEFRDGLAGCRGKDLLLAGHGAFGYLARKYGLVQTALYGLSPDSQPRPKDLMRAVDFCRQKGIRTVFFENSVPP